MCECAGQWEKVKAKSTSFEALMRLGGGGLGWSRRVCRSHFSPWNLDRSLRVGWDAPYGAGWKRLNVTGWGLSLSPAFDQHDIARFVADRGQGVPLLIGADREIWYINVPLAGQLFDQ